VGKRIGAPLREKEKKVRKYGRRKPGGGVKAGKEKPQPLQRYMGKEPSGAPADNIGGERWERLRPICDRKKRKGKKKPKT